MELPPELPIDASIVHLYIGLLSPDGVVGLPDVDGMAKALKKIGHGIMVAGRCVPLFMYADDVVLLVSTPAELAAESAVVTDFARRNRFEYNGKKSGVMVFNASPAITRSVRDTKWELSDKSVGVVGTFTTTNGGD